MSVLEPLAIRTSRGYAVEVSRSQPACRRIVDCLADTARPLNLIDDVGLWGRTDEFASTNVVRSSSQMLSGVHEPPSMLEEDIVI